MTTWRPVPGWGLNYEVSDTGIVRSIRRAVACVAPNGARTFRTLRSKRLRPAVNRRGHLRVMLGGPACSERRHAYVHVLVAEAFIGPRPEGLLVCHRDDNKRNNRSTNLYYGTRLDNAADYRRNRRL